MCASLPPPPSCAWLAIHNTTTPNPHNHSGCLPDGTGNKSERLQHVDYTIQPDPSVCNHGGPLSTTGAILVTHVHNSAHTCVNACVFRFDSISFRPCLIVQTTSLVFAERKSLFAGQSASVCVCVCLCVCVSVSVSVCVSVRSECIFLAALCFAAPLKLR